MTRLVPELGPEGANRATCPTCPTCPTCRAALVTAFTHIGTHRTRFRRITLPCPACGAPDTVTFQTAARGSRVGTAEVYRALFAPPWVRVRLPPTDDDEPSVLRDLAKPQAAIPLLAMVGLAALWARESGWVNVRPVLLGVLGGGAVFAGGLRLMWTKRLTAWRTAASCRENLYAFSLTALTLAVMIAIVLATG